MDFGGAGCYRNGFGMMRVGVPLGKIESFWTALLSENAH